MNRERSCVTISATMREKRRQGKDRTRLCRIIAQEVHETLSSRWQIVDRGRSFILGS